MHPDKIRCGHLESSYRIIFPIYTGKMEKKSNLIIVEATHIHWLQANIDD